MIMSEKVRIISMPEMRTVSKYVLVQEMPDDEIHVVNDYLKEQHLLGTARIFGCKKEPYAKDETESFGWVFYAAIPNRVPIPDNLIECILPGGLYAEMNVEDDVSTSWRELINYINGQYMYQIDVNRPWLEEFIPGFGNLYNITIYVAVQNI